MTPEARARHAAQVKAWRANNKERIRLYMAERRAKEIKPESAPKSLRAIPDDWAQYGSTESYALLRKRYGATSQTIRRWIEESGIGRSAVKAGPASIALPAGFAEASKGQPILTLAATYGVNKSVIRRWLGEIGVIRERFIKPDAPKRFIKPNAFATAPVDRPHRDASRAGLAAEYLRKFGPVIRCRPDGTYDPKGTCWRRNGRVLTAPEIIQRALDNNWQPDAWKQVQAA